MTRPVDRTGPVARSGRERRQAERRADPAPSEPALPVPIGEVRSHAPEPGPTPDAAFNAQLLGGPPRRGLKGGPETLDTARTTYLKTEYSGPADRRPKPGRISKTEA